VLLDAEPDFEVLAEAADVPGAMLNVRAHRPDVLVLDLNMPGGSSIEAIRRLAPISSKTAVVVLRWRRTEPSSARRWRRARRATHRSSPPGGSSFALSAKR
jgi:two-component system response regulator NreC